MFPSVIKECRKCGSVVAYAHELDYMICPWCGANRMIHAVVAADATKGVIDINYKYVPVEYLWLKRWFVTGQILGRVPLEALLFQAAIERSRAAEGSPRHS